MIPIKNRPFYHSMIPIFNVITIEPRYSPIIQSPISQSLPNFVVFIDIITSSIVVTNPNFSFSRSAFINVLSGAPRGILLARFYQEHVLAVALLIEWPGQSQLGRRQHLWVIDFGLFLF